VTKLRDLATTLRSKNADPFITTCDVFIPDPAQFLKLKTSGVLSRERIAQIYDLPDEAILGIYFIDSIQAIKVSFYKMAGGKYVASGDLEDMDVLGAQQHVPLAELDLPWDIPSAAKE
jgi:Domain of unknown function (DUF4387)